MSAVEVSEHTHFKSMHIFAPACKYFCSEHQHVNSSEPPTVSSSKPSAFGSASPDLQTAGGVRGEDLSFKCGAWSFGSRVKFYIVMHFIKPHTIKYHIIELLITQAFAFFLQVSIWAWSPDRCVVRAGGGVNTCPYSITGDQSRKVVSVHFTFSYGIFSYCSGCVCVCVCSQSAWQEVEQSYFELSQTRKRRGQLETELAALMRKAETANEKDPVSR